MNSAPNPRPTIATRIFWSAGIRSLFAFLSARGAPPPLALARRLRASSFDAAQDDPELVEGSLGPQALLRARDRPARPREVSRSSNASAPGTCTRTDTDLARPVP